MIATRPTLQAVRRGRAWSCPRGGGARRGLLPQRPPPPAPDLTTTSPPGASPPATCRSKASRQRKARDRGAADVPRPPAGRRVNHGLGAFSLAGARRAGRSSRWREVANRRLPMRLGSRLFWRRLLGSGAEHPPKISRHLRFPKTRERAQQPRAETVSAAATHPQYASLSGRPPAALFIAASKITSRNFRIPGVRECPPVFSS
jgi:hypothetical protein